MSRIDTLRSFVASSPRDPFPRYALALEFREAGRLDERWDSIDVLLREMYDYVPAYLHAGQLLLTIGRKDEARDVFRRGIATATRVGDGHARAELEGALAALGA